MRRIAILLVLALLPAASVAAQPGALARARALYNAGSYDAAIEAATTARRDPKAEDAAALVLARAHLERFRGAAAAAGDASGDLAAARETLLRIHPASLSPRDQVDLLIGLGQALYLSDSFGAASEVFETALGRASMLDARDRAKLLAWWAGALDRQAQGRSADRRAPLFARIIERMEEELRDDPGSVVANYWLVAATRGAGDLDRAWDAAIAGWVRAALGPDSATLRAELDRLASEALIPERARLHTAAQRPDPRPAMRDEWERVKREWK